MARKPAPSLDRFECFYHPCSRAGAPIPNEDGRLPSVLIDAACSGEAAERARQQVGFPIVETVRVAEDIKPPKKLRAKRSPKAALGALGLTTGAALLAALNPAAEEVQS